MASSSISPPSLSSSLQFSSAGEANSYRLKAIVERLNFIMKFIGNCSTEFFNLCFALARGVDYALTINDVPAVAHRFPSLIKEVYQRRKDLTLQPAIMMLMISVKNACKNGWFDTADADELLRMTNELFNSFCMSINVSLRSESALDIVRKLVSRFYPELKLCSLLVSFEAKPGYEILMSDFSIARNIPPEEKIRLIVVQTDNLETSSCIISPPQVSFIVNGKGVDRRTNVSQDSGPQFPTDITKMLKYGTNIIQAIGCFGGTYLIAIAFMNNIPLPAPVLEDYVHPVVSTTGSGEQDSEIIVGASRITLNCPISFRRIRTPVKGHLCKHHQCFDYDNFMEMNSRKPSWRCPFCNQPVSFIDLRIDQNMVKILKEVGKDVLDVIISDEGSWTVAELNGSKDRPSRENLKGLQDCSSVESESARSCENALADTVDLTMEEEDGHSDAATSPNQLGPINEAVSQSGMHSYETEDTKLFNLAVHKFLAEKLTNFPSMNTQPPSSERGNVSWPRVLSSSSLASSLNGLVLAGTAPDACVVGTSETTALPAFFVNPYAITDDVPPVAAVNQETQGNLEPNITDSTPTLVAQEEPLAENMQLEATFGNSMIWQETERLAIPRHVKRTPIAVQALPVPSQPQTQPLPLPLNSFKRMRINGPMMSNDFSTATYQTIQLPTDEPEMQALRASELSMPQDGDHQRSRSQVALQNVVSLPPPTAAISTSTTSVASSNPLQRGVGAYRAAAAAAASPFSSSTTSSSSSLHQLRSSSSLLPSERHHHQIQSTRSRNHHASLIATYRSNKTLPLGAAREMARQVSQQRVGMPQVGGGAAAVNLPQPSSSSSLLSPPTTGAAAAELAADQNWRPTGRMRGSLTGSAYSAALNQYLAPAPSTAQPAATPTSRPSSVETPIVAPLPPVTATTKQSNDEGRSQPKPGGSSFHS